MSKVVLFTERSVAVVCLIQLLLVHVATQGLTDIQADCSEDFSLLCQGVQGRDIRSITWYKFINQTRHGIIRKIGNKMQAFDFSRTANITEDYSLLLSSVKPEDSGTYECAIGANVGGINVNFRVNLIVSDCVTVTSATETSRVTHTEPFSPMPVNEVPLIRFVGPCAADCLEESDKTSGTADYKRPCC
ncbi:uncharacterized protein LOC130108329 isoform X2 [Lampris incognitus]|uniref:uncharacterized protein LOC130108329 isoform X2 n=1 Tax=Lampris incognitus TaxID=2546036 RepID=UPI0024B5A367|nr:uncharacterized protein LOC130108329 isoform X2 [Lampris incognitus]